MLFVGALEPAESVFFVAKRGRNCGNQRRRDVSRLPRLNKLRENVSRLRLLGHARVGDSKAATRQMRCFLGFGVKRDRFVEIALLAIRGGKSRIEIKIIWIQLE